MNRFFKKLWVKIRLLFNPANVKVQGECNQCGVCCRNMILVDGKKIVQSEKEFERLKARFPDIYGFFRFKSRNSDGDLVFECSQLNTDNTCSLYNSTARPRRCAAYPTKAMFKRGGKLFKECGYYVTPAVSFKEILDTEIES